MEERLKLLNKSQLRRHIQDIAKEIKHSSSLSRDHPGHYQFFLWLFQRHPRFPEKFEGLCDISLTHDPYLKVIIHKENGTQDTVSVTNACISGKADDTLYVAMRNAITDQILNFKEKQRLFGKLMCVKCKTTQRLEVDHNNPDFIDLYQAFILSSEDIPSSFDHHMSDNSMIFRKEDVSFEKRWSSYHLQNANLQILCKSCNCRKPKKKTHVSVKEKVNRVLSSRK